MAGFWGSRKREEREAQAAADSDLARQAGSALVAADERIRVTTDELEFARMELGDTATQPLAEGLEAVRKHLAEAYQLNQLNFDEIPDSAEELRTRNSRILQLCEWADDVLDERTAALRDRVERARRAPEVLADIRRRTSALAERQATADATVARLQERYTETALQQLTNGANEVGNLLAFATHSADVSERRRAAGNNEEANLALETSTEAVRRAATVLDSIDDYELEALRAESTLADVIADSRGDLVAARNAPKVPEVAAAATALERALAALTPGGQRNDPFAELTVLREANTALDAAIARAVERASRPVIRVETLQHQLDDADRQIAVARSLINGHRGWIGADARTRLAEAERTREGLDALVADEDTRDEALKGARRAADLASTAISLAQRDIDSSRPNDWGRGGRGGGGDNIMGGVIGGLLLGGLIGDIFD